VKVGDLVKYKSYPHRELQGLVGVITLMGGLINDDYYRTVWVVWNIDRPQLRAGTSLEEWMDELELACESR
jgi:hypothetical protein